MKTQIYIIGFLVRYGPMHGYKLMQVLKKQVSEFTDIRQPTLYYHLEKLREKGLLSSVIEQQGKRPERAVYSVTEAGKISLQNMLKEMLHTKYSHDYQLDNVLFFSDMIQTTELLDAFARREEIIASEIQEIKAKREEILRNVPEKLYHKVSAVISHQIIHMEAEIKWLKETSYDIIRSR